MCTYCGNETQGGGCFIFFKEGVTKRPPLLYDSEQFKFAFGTNSTLWGLQKNFLTWRGVISGSCYSPEFFEVHWGVG